ncbi:hypothetical protein EIP86_003059 [Pleurotus ostreatoroseus]|nr:hypothetical protein EIP86_003059 [Pleurotus ostreatoroseus]
MAKPTTRATRSASKNVPKSRAAESVKAKATSRGRKTNTRAKGRAELEHDSANEEEDAGEEDAEEYSGIESDEYEDENGDDDEDAAESINSDNLDDDSDVDDALSSRSKKRKRGATASSTSKSKNAAKGSPTGKGTANGKSTVKGKGKGKTSPNSTASASKKSSPRKKRKTARDHDEDDEDADEVDLDLEDGQEIVGRVVQAPTTGRVPPGQISQNTLNFLAQLKKPECNDREWFKLHEPVYRLAEKEWKDFIDAFTDVLVGADPQIPHLPPKDVIHRIYRDIMCTFSVLETMTVRNADLESRCRPSSDDPICYVQRENNLLRSSTRLRRIISSPTFVDLFGEPSPDPKGGRRSIFGREDELKVAPKGVAKDHKDIDLLKCRSFAVVYQFTDKQVLQPDFKDELGRLVKILRPFVHCLNDLMTIQDADDSDDDDGDEDEDEDENNAEDVEAASTAHSDDED